MAEKRFIPLSARGKESAETFDALHEGVPVWLLSSLVAWLSDVLPELRYASGFPAFVSAFERSHRIVVPVVNARDERRGFITWVAAEPDRLLDTIDYCLATLPLSSDHRVALDRALHEGGSTWRVSSTRRGLASRLDGTVHQIAKDVTAVGGRPSEHLRVAYEKAFGRNSDASSAYREAIRAVEAALRPVVEPKNPKATLGSMSAVVRNAPQDFQMRLQPGTGADPVQMFREMLALLWTSQLDRHGTDDESVPLTVSLEQAQDAVALATQVVQIVQTGGFTRR